MLQKIGALLRMGRFTILPGGWLAYALGTAMAYARLGSVNWGLAGLGFLITELANLAAHYADEYADVDTDTLARRTAFSGGSGVLPSGVISPAWALAAGMLLAGAALAAAAGAVISGLLSAHTLWIVAAGLLLGWFYSMPPLSLERRGLGEPVNALLGGILMPLMAYTVQARAPSVWALAALMPVFLVVLVGLLGVHWADRKADLAVGKLSLVVLLGERTRRFHQTLTVFAYILALLLTGWVWPWQVTAALFFSLPAALWSANAIARQEAPTAGSVGMAITLAVLIAGWVWAG